ncbi:peptidase inhibitor family I36 protein [Streptomyces sp. NPDC001927]
MSESSTGPGAPSAQPNGAGRLLVRAAFAGGALVTLPFLLIAEGGADEPDRPASQAAPAAPAETAKVELAAGNGTEPEPERAGERREKAPAPLKKQKREAVQEDTAPLQRQELAPAEEQEAERLAVMRRSGSPLLPRVEARPMWYGCDEGEMCLYGGPDGTGPLLALTPLHVAEMCDGFATNLTYLSLPLTWQDKPGYNDGATWNDQATSVWNRTDHTWSLFTDADHQGVELKMPAKAATNLQDIDKLSSLKPSWCDGPGN